MHFISWQFLCQEKTTKPKQKPYPHICTNSPAKPSCLDPNNFVFWTERHLPHLVRYLNSNPLTCSSVPKFHYYITSLWTCKTLNCPWLSLPWKNLIYSSSLLLRQTFSYQLQWLDWNNFKQDARQTFSGDGISEMNTLLGMFMAWREHE